MNRLFWMGVRFVIAGLIAGLAGCTHAELREQQCAQRCIERYARRAWGSFARGDRCYCDVDEGKLTSNRWPNE